MGWDGNFVVDERLTCCDEAGGETTVEAAPL